MQAELVAEKKDFFVAVVKTDEPIDKARRQRVRSSSRSSTLSTSSCTSMVGATGVATGRAATAAAHRLPRGALAQGAETRIALRQAHWPVRKAGGRGYDHGDRRHRPRPPPVRGEHQEGRQEVLHPVRAAAQGFRHVHQRAGWYRRQGVVRQPDAEPAHVHLLHPEEALSEQGPRLPAHQAHRKRRARARTNSTRASTEASCCVSSTKGWANWTTPNWRRRSGRCPT